MMAQETTSQIKNPISRYTNILKSPTDEKGYRGLILHNELKVLLISDPTTDKSAASLDVNVGSLNDPKKLPGLAHLCEHMLFLATSESQQQLDFNYFLKLTRGGKNDATSLDHTNFFFNIDPAHLENALDRFSRFFTAPTFSESNMTKIINSIEYEYSCNSTSDLERLQQLDQSSSDPDHAYSKFGLGNNKTLRTIPEQNNIDVKNELLEFYNKYYSSNITTLCVLGKESLDELENMVIKMFSDIKNKKYPTLIWEEHPFKEEHFGNKWYIVPIKDVRYLILKFEMPDLHEATHIVPEKYWSYLLTHKGKGNTLLSVLKKKGWCNSLQPIETNSARGFDFFSIQADLTESGLVHVDDIITMIFQYINMLKKEGPQEWIFKELRDTAIVKFRAKKRNLFYVWSIARHLHDYPIDRVLSDSYIITEWNPGMINDLGQYLVPERLRVQIVAKVFEVIADSVEPWYGTKYKKQKISDEVINRWKNAGFNECFQLPDKNEFIPAELDIKQHEEQEKFPTIIEDGPLMRLWFKQDNEFLLPMAVIKLHFVSPISYVDPTNCGMTHLFVKLLEDSLKKDFDGTNLVGLNWELRDTKYGFTLSLDGYDHKIKVLLEKILSRMQNLTVDEKIFKILKENYFTELKSFEESYAHDQVLDYLEELLSEKYWSKTEILASTTMVTFQKLQQFIPMLLDRIHVECLIHGNVTKSEALQIAQLVNYKATQLEDPVLPREMLLHRELQLPKGSHFLYVLEKSHCQSFALNMYYQCGLQSTETNMLLELIWQIINERYKTRGIEEQFNCKVFRYSRKLNSVQGLSFTIQNPQNLKCAEEKVDDFIKYTLDHFKAMTDEGLNRHKELLTAQLLRKPRMLIERSKIYWAEIFAQQYNFDRANIETAYLKTITREQIIKFFEDKIYSSKLRRKLSICVMPSSKGPESTVEAELGPVRIKNVIRFKSNHSLYPLVDPFIDVPRKGMQRRNILDQ